MKKQISQAMRMLMEAATFKKDLTVDQLNFANDTIHNVEQDLTFDELFELQSRLNDRVFIKQGFDIRAAELIELGRLEEIGVNTATCHWLKNYLTALKDECRELSDELPWKWWSKDKLDMQNIRVEIIDILHFWISLAMTAGMTAEDIKRIYLQKLQVNLDRQENDYSKATKDETDNKGIQ